MPVGDRGRERYRRYLELGVPKAFAVTEKGGSHLSGDDVNAMSAATEACAKAGVKCWLYAVDDRVAWSPNVRDRIDATRHQRKPNP